MSLDAAQLERFAVDLAADPAQWRHLVRHQTEIRVYEQIWSDESVNAWVICWADGHDTGFHDHDNSAAAIAVISGEIREERLTFDARPLARQFGPGERLSIPAHAIHRVLHAGSGPAITVHAYSPPLVRTGAYRIGGNGELERESQHYEVELGAAASG